MRIFITLLMLFSFVAAKEIRPVAVFTVRGFVNDFVVADGRLFVATDRGTVDIFDIEKMKLVYQIVLDPVPTGRGELAPVRVLSVDVMGRRVLITGIVEEGFRAVWLFENFDLKPMVEAKARLTIKEARFDAEGHVVLGTFSSELIRYSPEERAPLYREKPAETSIGDMAMSSDRRHVVLSDESGAVRVVHARSGAIVRVLPSRHLDNVFHVAAAAGVVVTGGNDRRVCVFNGKRSYDFRTGFPVYCVGVSPDGKTGVYLKGDAQVLQLFDIETGKEKWELVGHEAVVNQIRFVDERRMFSSEKGPRILLWELPDDQ
ncbi:WD40 repeat domain-containing protein [Hydrogenimonas sp.]